MTLKSKYENVYEPEEDSKLLLKHIINQIKHDTIGKPKEKLNQISICEIGVGSGFVISNLAKQFPELNYFGSDINPSATDLTKLELSKIKTKTKPNLQNKPFFDGFNESQKFDYIIFNTPYFPFESKNDSFENMTMKDRAIYGGKNGFEVINEFTEKCLNKFSENGVGIMIFSSLSNLGEIEKHLKKLDFNFQMLESENSFFEKIHCLKFWPSDELKLVLKINLKNLKRLSAGKHSTIFQCQYNNQPAIVKVGKYQYLQKEGIFEEKLKNEEFVPKMFKKGDTYIIREMFTGQNITEFLENPNTTKKELIVVLNEILKITQKMDELKINKFEMTNPYKHIYIEENLKVGFIDFERCIYQDNPKNTTQVLQYFKKKSKQFKEKFDLELNTENFIEIGKNYHKTKEKFDIKKLIKHN